MSALRLRLLSGLLLAFGGPIWVVPAACFGQQPAASPPSTPQPAAPQPAAADQQRSAAQPLTPSWNLGDKWTVEAVSRPLQARRGGDLPAMRPIQWQFALSRFEKTLEHDCYRVEVRCLESDDGHPLTQLWIDRQSRALRQVTTEIPVPGGFQQMTISYEFDAVQPAPVLGPLTALPIDLPAALAAGAKTLQSFEYTALIGPPGRKELGDLAFAYGVEQSVAPIAAADVRQLMSGSFVKSLDNEAFAKSLSDEAIKEKPVTEVRLKSAGRQIRQLWQQDKPWPIYCDNGYCVSRLVSHVPAAGQKEQP